MADNDVQYQAPASPTGTLRSLDLGAGLRMLVHGWGKPSNGAALDPEALFGATNSGAAASEATDTGLNGIAKGIFGAIRARLPASLGSLLSANSLSVVLASNHASVPVTFSNGQFGTATATIASGANVSGTVDLGTTRLFAISMPTAWTAADIAFQASIDGTTWADVFTDDGTRLYVFNDGYTAGGRFIPLLNPSIFLGIRWLRLVSRTTSGTVNQGAARDVTLVTMP